MGPAGGGTPSCVAVVGGGRWARVIAGVLATLRQHVILCSPTYAEGWSAWLDAMSEDQRARFVVESSLAKVLGDARAESVCVVRRAQDNAETAIAALQAGKATFVEKPFALTPASAERVAAAAAGRRCRVGHVMLFASNVRAFALAAARCGHIEKIRIAWCDAGNEFRHGESKRYDHSINVVADALPHVWSLIKLLLPAAPMAVRLVESSRGGRRVVLTLTAGTVEVCAVLERDAAARSRKLQVVSEAGLSELDFSTEPGTAFVCGEEIDVAAGFTSPLARELAFFQRPWGDPIAERFTDVVEARETVILASAAGHRVRAQQAAAIRRAAGQGLGSDLEAAALFALREWIAGERRQRGQATQRPGRDDEQAARDALAWLTGARDQPPPDDVAGSRWIADLLP